MGDQASWNWLRGSRLYFKIRNRDYIGKAQIDRRQTTRGWIGHPNKTISSLMVVKIDSRSIILIAIGVMSCLMDVCDRLDLGSVSIHLLA